MVFLNFLIAAYFFYRYALTPLYVTVRSSVTGYANFNFGFFTLIVFITLFFTTFSVSVTSLFFSHLFLHVDAARLLRGLLLLFMLILALFSLPTPSSLWGKSPTFFFFDKTILISTFLVFFILLISSNVFTSIICVEILAILSLGFLVADFCAASDYRSCSKVLRAFIIFFWVNALTSLVFFFLVLLISDSFGIFSNLSLFLNCGLSSDTGFRTNPLTFAVIILSVIVKLALPPVLFWKIFLFNNSPLRFVAYYSVFFFPPILHFFIKLVDAYLHYNFVHLSAPLISIFLALTLLTLAVSLFSNSWGTFFAVSGCLTAMLLILFALISWSCDSAFINYALALYLIFYSLSVAWFMYIVFAAGLSSGSKPLQHFVSSILGTSSSSHMSLVLPAFFGLSFLSGLPPFLTFYVKLAVFAELFVWNTSSWLLFVVVLFFFMLLFFYFKNARFFLVEQGVITNSKISSKLRSDFVYGPSFSAELTDSTTSSPSNNNVEIWLHKSLMFNLPFILVLGFFSLPELLLLSAYLV